MAGDDHSAELGTGMEPPLLAGESFGWPSKRHDVFVLSNVLGLAYIRLQDAVIDGERWASRHSCRPLLSTVLYRRWLQVYIDLFGGDGQFWGYFDRFLDEWLSAAADSELPRDFRAYTAEDYLRLAHRARR